MMKHLCLAMCALSFWTELMETFLAPTPVCTENVFGELQRL